MLTQILRAGLHDDEDLLPAEDACAGVYRGGCGKTRAEHTGYLSGGPNHDFVEPQRQPKEDLYVSAHIQTDWTCARCGASCDVWGQAEGWMECDQCGRSSYLVPFMNG